MPSFRPVHVWLSDSADTLLSAMPDTDLLEAPFALPQPLTAPDLLAKYFKVLSDRTRVRIVELLDEHGELTVGELVLRLKQSQPKVSNHLACLRWCGFVERERRHPNVFYRVADGRVLQMLELGRSLLADNAEHVAACERVDGKGC